jgi:cobalt-precorrin 5A hydrolase/precorrin-3B C17-methyltransferase
VGIGCQRGTSKTLIEYAVREVLRTGQFSAGAIAGIATIEQKASEAGLLEFCRDRNLPLRVFPAEVLRSVAVPNPSRQVEAQIGTPSIAEAAALCAASGFLSTTADLPAEAESHQHLRLFASPRLCCEKKVFHLAGQPGSVTAALAQMESQRATPTRA